MRDVLSEKTGSRLDVDPPSNINPKVIIPRIAPIFRRVNRFWNRAPDLTSRIFRVVNMITDPMAIPLIPQSDREKKCSRYSAKATPIAAIADVLITATADQPYK